MRRSSGSSGSRSSIARCTATAASTAAVTLWNSTIAPVALEVDEPPAMPLQDRLDQLLAQLPEAGEGAGLVLLHQARIADHVRRQDRGEAALDARRGRHGFGYRHLGGEQVAALGH